MKSQFKLSIRAFGFSLVCAGATAFAHAADAPLAVVNGVIRPIVILLTLLSLGIKNIRLVPTLPAFVTPRILNFLVEKFGI